MITLTHYRHLQALYAFFETNATAIMRNPDPANFMPRFPPTFSMDDMTRSGLFHNVDMRYFQNVPGDSPETIRLKMVRAYVYYELVLLSKEMEPEMPRLGLGTAHFCYKDKIGWMPNEYRLEIAHRFQELLGENVKRIAHLMGAIRMAVFKYATLKEALSYGKMLTGFLKGVEEGYDHLIQIIEKTPSFTDKDFNNKLFPLLKENKEKFKKQEYAVLGAWDTEGPAKTADRTRYVA